MAEETDQEVNKKLLMSILSRLESIEKKNQDLEAENKALKAEKEASKPKDPIQQMMINEKKRQETKEKIDMIRKNVRLGELVIAGIKRDLIPRQRSQSEE